MTDISVHPLTPCIGAEISGVDLRETLSDGVMRELQQALLDWKVIFFRDQDISIEDQLRMGRWFGELEVHPFYQGERHPEVMRFVEDDKSRIGNNMWHSDVSAREAPSYGAILRAIEVPDVGGDTLWANMEAAYEGLSDDIKRKIDDAVAIHDWHLFHAAALKGNYSGGERRQMRTVEEVEELKRKYPAQAHPVVRTHPVTGRKCLYVNVMFTRHLKANGLDKTESGELLNYLYSQARVPEYQCRFRWRKHSVAFWDNRCTQHYAQADYVTRRVMERVTIAGDRPH